SPKRANESTSPGTPTMINIPPRMRVRSRPKKAGRNSHYVTHQGTKPASTNGAMTKNRAEPKTAITFDIAYSRTTGSAQPSSTSRCYSENRRRGRRVIRQWRFGDSYSGYHYRSGLGAATLRACNKTLTGPTYVPEMSESYLRSRDVRA